MIAVMWIQRGKRSLAGSGRRIRARQRCYRQRYRRGYRLFPSLPYDSQDNRNYTGDAAQKQHLRDLQQGGLTSDQVFIRPSHSGQVVFLIGDPAGQQH